MIRLSNVNLSLDYTDCDIKNIVSKQLRINKSSIETISLHRRSIDARHKNDVHFVATFDITLNTNENIVVSKSKNKNASICEKYKYEIPYKKDLNNRPVVIGFGPAGMFCALILAQCGQKPIVIERGDMVENRTKKVQSLWNNSVLDTESNVQFGEGGAGTFSDGKLNTGTKDSKSRNVLIEFVKHGAPQEILFNAKPHIGTDKLRTTVANIRKDIISLGGEIRFNTKLVGINHKDGKVTSIETLHNNKKDVIETDNVILAIGHSARDTFEMLNNMKIFMEPKIFSVGARIEHLRESIDRAQYGDFYKNEKLGAADYKMNAKASNGRGVYTFCMCPGGVVVAAQSEENTVVTNGMSNFSRDEINSNCALLVNVYPEDFGTDDVLSGVEFQRKIERNAFIYGGSNYSAPVQRISDFLKKSKTEVLGEVVPSYKPGIKLSNFDNFLPEYVTDAMREGILAMDKKLKGFAHPDAVLTGAETRSSSPIRILRNESLQSVSLKGLYPCGEGAGYAGGIISAAVDGIKCAEQILINA